ncbi:MAG: hypothetical protein P8Q14_10290 [Vicingaceae bacterium]|nr:hypothetical protein [Vicingaceae bacterium]
MVKTKIACIILVLLFFSCQEKNETSAFDSVKATTLKDTPEKTPYIELNHWPKQMPQIDYNQFEIKGIEEFNVALATKLKDSCTNTSDSLNKYLYLHNYFTKLNFNENFTMPVFISVEETNMLILGTIDPKGKLLGNLVLANESSWENGDFEIFSKIESDSIIHRTAISREHDQDENGYKPTWSTITIKEIFHISSSGYIFLINTERTEDMNHKAPDNTLTNEQPNTTLPSPGVSLITDQKLGMIDKLNSYLKENFSITETAKVLETTTANHPDGIYDCHLRTEYGNIIFETYTCDHQLENTLKFNGYSFKEVKRVLSVLFTDNEYFKWYDKYRYEPKEESGAGCFLEMKEDKNSILVSYGCGC